MPKISFIAECGNPGADNTTIDLTGLGFPRWPVKLLTNFNQAELVGFCSVTKAACRTEQALLVEADVPDQLLDFYPAIGFSVLDSQPNEHGGRTITACTLQAVSLSASPNVDPAIKTLREQLASNA